MDGRLRGAFYRALVPSAAVRGLMAPVLERIDAARIAAAEAGQAAWVVGAGLGTLTLTVNHPNPNPNHSP